MTTISAKTILRSRNAVRPDKVLSTLLLRYPRWIHAEQRTHRIIPLCEEEDIFWAPSTPSLMDDPNLSRNAASSRAIPVSKLIDDVLNDPAIPLLWGKNRKGMQATEEFTGAEREELIADWLKDRDHAVERARFYAEFGCHKQIVNRLLEPFSHITVLVSATEWDNFLELRDHEDAEPHIRLLARAITSCLNDQTTIQTLQPGEWHLPFVADDDPAWKELYALDIPQIEAGSRAIKLSVARCASTSYKTVDGFDMTIGKAVEFHDKLLASKPIHASPAEHVAQVDYWDSDTDGGAPLGWRNPDQHRNFEGFRQYRAMIEG